MLAVDETALQIDLTSFVIDAVVWVVVADIKKQFRGCSEVLISWLTLENCLSRNVFLSQLHKLTAKETSVPLLINQLVNL